MRRITVLAALVVAIAVASTAIAGTAELVRLKGWVVDEEGGAEHANAASLDLVKAAHDAGKTLVFVTNDRKVYTISNPDRAIEHAGKEVTIIGKLDGEELTIGSALTPIQPPQN